ncbi:MAG TPA: cytochrome P450 [Thermoleophilaceae bacterium]|nr:cytochrome P450 [Thermoleophilaceae bacterium]
MSLPPGPKLPGLAQTLGMLSRPHGFLGRCRRRYGDVFSVNIAPYGRMVFLADPELIRQVFTGDTRLFHVGGVRGRVLSPLLGEHSLLLLDEDEHMRERKLMLPAFHGEALRRYPLLIEEIAEEQVSRWPVGEPVALRPRMQAITLEVILRLVIGVRDTEALARLRDLLGRLLDQPTTLLFLATALKRDISWFRPWRRFLEIRAQADELIHKEIARRRAEPSGDDILSLLVQASGDSMSDEDLRDELMTLLIAGHETTATALAWVFERLTRHPAALARLREGDPAYLDAVIKETLRVRPVVMEVGRDITESVRLGPWELPAGTRVMSSIGLVQKAERHWPDPHAFRPERFLDGQPAPYTWIPFGGGPRRCIGASFAATEMAAIIPVVLRHFDLVPDRPEAERSQTRNVTQVPERGARVVLSRRAPELQRQGVLSAA